MNPSQPIGIFDSGVGGLSVVRELQRLLPYESYYYCADNAWFPYGELGEEQIRDRVISLSRFLVNRGAKLIVIACNTATAAAVESVREELQLPVVAVEPAVKPAVQLSRTRRIAVLATPHTLTSRRLAKLISSYAKEISVVRQACEGWVQQVESGEVDGERAMDLVSAAINPLKEQGVDVLVLGCTHFPFLRPIIEQVAGSGHWVIDSGMAVARQVERLLSEHVLMNRSSSFGELKVWTTGDATRVEAVLGRLGWAGIGVERLERI